MQINAIPENTVKGFKMALAMSGISVPENIAEQILQIHIFYTEKSYAYSLNEAAFINDYISQQYKSVEED